MIDNKSLNDKNQKDPLADAVKASTEATPNRFDYASNPTWRIFRIMAEFVDGFDFIERFDKPVTFFGSARTPKDDDYYHKARELAARLAGKNYTIITGGGPGIMEAANEGAKSVGKESIGLNIQLPNEQRTNPYVTKGVGFEYFFSRKVMLSFASQAYIFFPGGYGTLDEAFEMLTLIQTQKVEDHIPVVLFGSDYWGPLIEWMQVIMLEKFEYISPEDLNMFELTDDLDRVIEIVEGSTPRSGIL